MLAEFYVFNIYTLSMKHLLYIVVSHTDTLQLQGVYTKLCTRHSKNQFQFSALGGQLLMETNYKLNV